jgi:hypothetical protein
MDKDFRILEMFKKCDDGTESYSTTCIPKMFPTLAPSHITPQGDYFKDDPSQ